MKNSIFCILALLCFSIHCNNALCRSISDAEKTVLGYAKAFQDQDWANAVTYLHPKLIKDMQNQIIDILRKVKKSDLNELLSQFGVKAIKDLEVMPPEQFYIINQQRRFKDAKIDARSMNRLRFEVSKAKISNDKEYMIELRSAVDSKNAHAQEFKTFKVVEFENNWKIVKITQNK